MITPVERCGSPGPPQYTLTCDLPRGHAKGLLDWHEARADSTQRTEDYEYQRAETVRWAPRNWELASRNVDTETTS